MKLNLLKEKILTECDQIKIYNHYTGLDLHLGRAYKSPLRDKDKHPSFNIFRHDKTGIIMWKDFADNYGNVIDFVKQLYEIDFVTAIKRIASDFKLDEFNLDIHVPKKKLILEKTNDEPTIKIEYKTKSFSKEELKFWNSFGIPEALLIANNVVSIDNYRYTNRDGAARGFLSTPNNPIFGIVYPSGHLKIYSPLGPKPFKWRSNVRAGIDFWGIDKLTPDTTEVIIASGIKDALCLQQFTGVKTVFPNSETSYPTLEQYRQLTEYNRKVYILFDNDETGVKQSARMSEKFLVTDLRSCLSSLWKDVAEYYEHKIKNRFDEDPLTEKILTIIHEKSTHAITD